MIDKIYRQVVRTFGARLHINGKGDIAALPLLLLLISVLTFASTPFSNAVSRYQENAADQYGMELTRDREAAVDTFQDLAVTGLTQVNPPLLVKLFRNSHPSIMERIEHAETNEKTEEDPTSKPDSDQ